MKVSDDDDDNNYMGNITYTNSEKENEKHTLIS